MRSERSNEHRLVWEAPWPACRRIGRPKWCGRPGGAAVYLESVSKVDIADRIGISRFRVARLLDAARDDRHGRHRRPGARPVGHLRRHHADWVRRLAGLGICAELAGRSSARAAGLCPTPLDSRVIVTPGPALQRIPFVLCVACGVAKNPAVFIAIRGGLVHGLVIHASLARALLSLASKSVGGP